MSVFDLIYGILLLLFSPVVVVKLLIDPQFRLNLRSRFSPFSHPLPLSSISGNAIWVHGASIGEIKLAIKLIEAWQKVDPARSFFITTNTLQSLNQALKETDVPVLPAPIDLSPVVKQFIQRAKPAHLVLIETEIWPNMIQQMAERGSVAIVNGRLSDRYFKRYLRFRKMLSGVVSRIDQVLARDNTSAERFRTLGISPDRIMVQGNLKYDIPHLPDRKILDQIQDRLPDNQEQYLMVAGSIQPEELSHILPAWKSLKDEIPGFRLIIIPRHPDKKDEFASILTEHEIQCSFDSDNDNHLLPKIHNHIHVVDMMGVLKSWYAISDIIFVGGSLCARGGQNMVEAVGYKKPVCIGPFATNFKDEVSLLTGVNGLTIIHNAEELAAFVRDCHHNPDRAAAMGQRGYQAIAEQADTLATNVQTLIELFNHK